MYTISLFPNQIYNPRKFTIRKTIIKEQNGGLLEIESLFIFNPNYKSTYIIMCSGPSA